MIENIKNYPKEFYRWERKKSTVKSEIGPLKNEKNKSISGEKEMSEILSSQYQSMFSQPSEDITKMDLNNLNCVTFSSIENIEISIGMIQ